MLVIRLQRTGRSNLATYRVVVTEKARAAKGKFQEILGHYLPSHKDSPFQVDTDRIAQWIAKGAIPSDTLARLLKRQGMKNMDKFIIRYTKQKSKSAPEAEPTPKQTEPAVTSESTSSQSAGDNA